MGSFEKALQFVLENKIKPLTQFMGKISKLDRELDTLNRMKEDIESKLAAELQRPGRRRSGLVDKWLKDVEQIEMKRGDIMNQINEICTYESIDEVIEEVKKEVEKYLSERPSSDSGNILEGKAIDCAKKTIVGIGGIDGANTNLTNSPITFHFRDIHMRNCDHTQGNGADGEGRA